MCRNITELRGLEPPATADEVWAAARQYVGKVSGLTKPPDGASDAFEAAVADVATATTRLLAALPPRRQPPKTVPPLRVRKSGHGWEPDDRRAQGAGRCRSRAAGRPPDRVAAQGRHRGEALPAIEDLHIWTGASIRADRLDFRPRHRLTVLVLAASPLSEPLELGRDPRYGGCTSWVDVPSSPALGGPVYDAAVLAEVARRVRATVG